MGARRFLKVLRTDWSVDLRPLLRGSVGSAFMRVRSDSLGCAYVVEPNGGTILKFDRSGDIRLNVQRGASRDGPNQPRDIAIDSDGHLLVADWAGSDADHRVVTLDPGGRFVGYFVSEGPPEAIAVDSKGHVYLHVPTSEWRVHKYSRDGDWLLRFGTRPRRADNPAIAARRDGRTPILYELLSCVAVSAGDVVNFAPGWIYKIQRFRSDGSVIGYLQRRIQERAVRTAPSGGVPHSARTLAVLDVSASVASEQLYVLRAHRRHGSALVDVWSEDGRRLGEVRVEKTGSSIAVAGDTLYLLSRGLGPTLHKYILGGF